MLLLVSGCCICGGGYLLVALSERMADREVDQDAPLSLQAPTLDVELWGSTLACCELRNHLLSPRLETSCQFSLVQNVAPFAMCGIGCTPRFAIDRMLTVRIC